MLRWRLALCVLALACYVSPARAGAIGYSFIEGRDGPNPGRVAAFLLINSPPGEPGSGWTTLNVADILSFAVFDGDLAPGGDDYTPQLISSSLSSNTGATLDFGLISGTMSPSAKVETVISASPGSSIFTNLVTGRSSHGDWMLSLTEVVPEPPSMVMATIAATGGVVLSIRRRKRSDK